MRKFLYHIICLAAVALFTVQAAAQDAANAYMGIPFFRNYSASEYNAHNRNFDVLCDGEGHTFYANFEGLLVYDKVQWRIVHTPDISRVVSLGLDEDGKVIFEGITSTGRVLSIDGDSVCVAFAERAGSNASALAGGERVNQTVVDRWNDIEVYPRLKVSRERTLLATATDGVIAVDADGREIWRINVDNGLCSNSISKSLRSWPEIKTPGRCPAPIFTVVISGLPKVSVFARSSSAGKSVSVRKRTASSSVMVFAPSGSSSISFRVRL